VVGPSARRSGTVCWRTPTRSTYLQVLALAHVESPKERGKENVARCPGRREPERNSNGPARRVSPGAMAGSRWGTRASEESRPLADIRSEEVGSDRQRGDQKAWRRTSRRRAFPICSPTRSTRSGTHAPPRPNAAGPRSTPWYGGPVARVRSEPGQGAWLPTRSTARRERTRRRANESVVSGA
jgi:hypothetical protein